MSPTWKPEGSLDTPYRRAAAEWDARMGSAIVQARSWRLATFASLGAVGLSVLGLVYLGAQPKLVPHIVEVDRLGAATYHGPAGEGTYAPSDAVITYELRRFLEDARTISSDLAVLKKSWFDAYALVTPKGGNMLSAYVREHDPFARAEQGERAAIEVLGTVRVSSDTWQIDWREQGYGKDGNPSGAPGDWRAMLRTVLVPPKTAEEMRRNPIGLYIDELHWAEVQSQSKAKP